VCPVCVLKSALQSENNATVTELRFEHYQILKNEDQSLMELGHGAMEVTYKALDVELQRPVALKIINAKLIGNASARQRFAREARAAASVRHPNVAAVTDIGFGKVSKHWLCLDTFSIHPCAVVTFHEPVPRMIERLGKLVHEPLCGS
jgi:serine/threonine protein kinase